MAKKAEEYSYRQFKTALDNQYNLALEALAIDGLASANWIQIADINDAYNRVWSSVSLAAGKKAKRAITGAATLVDDAWRANTVNFLQRNAGERIREVWATSKQLYIEAVNDAVVTATNEGLGAEATQRRIRQLVNNKLKGDINIWRARRIARTETVAAGNYGTWQGMVDAVNSDGARIQKKWKTSFRDSRTAHKEAHDQIREVGQPFEVGGELLQFPGDPSGSARNVINCQCVMQETLLNFVRY